MRVEFHKTSIEVFREKGDKAFYGIQNAAGESAFLYHLKKVLNSQGYDLIKKRMWRDGHMVSDIQQYLRTRKPSGDSEKDIYIYNTFWAIEGVEMLYNKGSVVLGLVKGIFEGGSVGI